VRGLLKYIQYRDTRDDHIPVAGGPDRWVDGGLGSCYQHILARLDDLSVGNRHAYCQEWEAWRQEHDPKPQVGPIEYSFVVHRPAREYGEQMHAHVILGAATEQAMTGERTPLYNNPAEIAAFKEIAGRQLDRVYEIEREPEREPPPPGAAAPGAGDGGSMIHSLLLRLDEGLPLRPPAVVGIGTALARRLRDMQSGANKRQRNTIC